MPNVQAPMTNAGVGLPCDVVGPPSLVIGARTLVICLFRFRHPSFHSLSFPHDRFGFRHGASVALAWRAGDVAVAGLLAGSVHAGLRAVLVLDRNEPGLAAGAV